MTGILLLAAWMAVQSAPACASEVWREGLLRTPGAGAIHYRLRAGEGEGVLLVHGRSFGSEAFSLWEGLLPGRPLMILDRRGYAPSQGWAEPLGERNRADVARALSFLRSVSGSKKAAVVVFSMGARFLPELDPEVVSWVAMINPSGPPLAGYLDARGQAAAESLREGYERTRFWLPFAREAWIASAAWSIASDARERLARQGGDSPAASAMLAGLDGRSLLAGFRGALVRETLFALHDDSWRVPEGTIPVLLAFGAPDELIPSAAYREAAKRLARGRAFLRVVELNGGHLAPLLDPGAILDELERFDSQAEKGAGHQVAIMR